MTRQRLSTVGNFKGFGKSGGRGGGRLGWMLVTEPDAHLNINSVLSGYISNAGTTCTHGRKSLGFTYLPIYRNVNRSPRKANVKRRRLTSLTNAKTIAGSRIKEIKELRIFQTSHLYYRTFKFIKRISFAYRTPKNLRYIFLVGIM